jgi:alkaline phosphatase
MSAFLPAPSRRGARAVARALPVLAIGVAVAIPVAASAGSSYKPNTSVGHAPGHARNVIMFLGDGMGDSEITVARNYAVGAAGRLPGLDAFHNQGEYTTFAVREDAPASPDYVTDSAASGTGWATGRKTSNGRISTTAGTDRDLPTILEIAKAAGMRTGDVSTAELTDATPAVLASHVSARGCQGPADMAACPQDAKQNGGPGSIAEQEVDHNVDVLLGGGQGRFTQLNTGGKYTGQSVVAQAQAKGYQYVTTAADLAATKAGPFKKVLGLFSAGNMDLELTGPAAVPYPGNPAARCTTNAARTATAPHLADMTTKALDLLSTKRGPGFFLQVEGASIDKQDHAANVCGQIGETLAFDEAIQAGLAYQATHPDTLVVVTADHGHTSQIVEAQTDTDHSPGDIVTVTTADGQPMIVNYATNLHGRSQSHTGTEVRIVASGPQSDRVMGTTDQTDLFRTFRAALGL